MLVLMIADVCLSHSLLGGEAPLLLKKLNPTNFAQHYPLYSVLSHQAPPFFQQQKRKASPLGSRELLARQLTDHQTTPYEKSRAEIIVLERAQPRWRLELNGFKNFSAGWVSEEIVRVEVWPGKAVQLIELINIESGAVLYRSATEITTASPTSR